MSWEEIKAEELKACCDPHQLPYETTEKVPPLEEMIGQARAVRAMEFGLRVKRHGYNIFMSGTTGTGKSSYARSLVRKVAAAEPVPDDWCYVYNFENPGEPIALNLPAGMGAEFCRHVEELLEDLKQNIPKAFDGEDYERQKPYMKEFQEARSAHLEELNKAAQEQGFTLKRTSSGFVTVPLIEGEQLGEDDYANLDKAVKDELEKKSTELQLKAMEIMRRVQGAERNLKEKLKQLDQRIANMATGYLFNEILEKYADFPAVQKYLRAFNADVLSNLQEFKGEEEESQVSLFLLRRQSQEQAEIRYKVNLLIDNRETQRGAHGLRNQSFISQSARPAGIRKSLWHRGDRLYHDQGGRPAPGQRGYLIRRPAMFKRSPVVGSVEAGLETRKSDRKFGRTFRADYHVHPARSRSLAVKVVMIGSPYLYHLLYYYDEDFRKLFKIKADFDVEMERNDLNCEKMAGFISEHCKREGLRPFDRFAVARVVEFSSRQAEHQEKLSTRFNDIVELLYEADTWAEIDGVEIIGAAQVEKRCRKIYRSDQYRQKINEAIEKGQILLDLEGKRSARSMLYP